MNFLTDYEKIIGVYRFIRCFVFFRMKWVYKEAMEKTTLNTKKNNFSLVNSLNVFITIYMLFFAITNQSAYAISLETDPSVHGNNINGILWDVCRSGTPICWMFQEGIDKELAIKDLSKNPSKYNPLSPDRSSGVLITSDRWGNQRQFSVDGQIVASAKYGEKLSTKKAQEARNYVKGYSSIASEQSCSENSIGPGGLVKVARIKNGVGPTTNIPKKYQFLLERVIKVKNKLPNGKGVWGSAVLVGENCQGFVSSSHLFTIRDEDVASDLGKEVGSQINGILTAYNSRIPNKESTRIGKVTNVTDGLMDNMVTISGFTFLKDDTREDWAAGSFEGNHKCNSKIQIKDPRDCKGEVFYLGYDQYHGNKPIYGGPCGKYNTDEGFFDEVFGEKDNKDFVEVYAHRCSTYGGSSGAGIFCAENIKKNGETKLNVSLIGVNNGGVIENQVEDIDYDSESHAREFNNIDRSKGFYFSDFQGITKGSNFERAINDKL